MEILIIITILLITVYIDVYFSIEREIRKMEIELIRMKKQIEIVQHEINDVLASYRWN